MFNFVYSSMRQLSDEDLHTWLQPHLRRLEEIRDGKVSQCMQYMDHDVCYGFLYLYAGVLLEAQCTCAWPTL